MVPNNQTSFDYAGGVKKEVSIPRISLHRSFFRTNNEEMSEMTHMLKLWRVHNCCLIHFQFFSIT